MGDLESLLLVVVLIYLVDCLIFLRRGSTLFTRIGSHWRIHQAGTLVANDRGGLRLLSPLTRYPSSFLSGLLPFSPSPEGVLGWTSLSLDMSWRPQQTLAYWKWQDIQELRFDRRFILINRQRFAVARTGQEAIILHQLLKDLHRAPPAERETMVRSWIAGSLETDGVQARLREIQPVIRRASWQAHGLALFVFLASPALIWKFGLALVGWKLLAGIYAQTIALAIPFARAHQRFYPHDSDERLVRVLTTALAPMSAIRAPDYLARHSLTRFHPLAIAQVLCPTEDFRAFATQVLRDVYYPMLPECPSKDPTFAATERWARLAWQSALTRFLSGLGISPEECLKAPIAADASTLAYCPRCLSQFVDLNAVCTECGNRSCLPMENAPKV